MMSLNLVSLYSGIVGNQIYDPTANIRVSLSGGSANGNEVQWWNRSDPIWLLARKKVYLKSCFKLYLKIVLFNKQNLFKISLVA